jgi:hypothetical protein
MSKNKTKDPKQNILKITINKENSKNSQFTNPSPKNKDKEKHKNYLSSERFNLLAHA